MALFTFTSIMIDDFKKLQLYPNSNTLDVYILFFSHSSTLPSEHWSCNTCSLDISPKCELCPNTGGAMKSTKTGLWVHLICALWTPEIDIDCVEKMEPITKISKYVRLFFWDFFSFLCSK